MAKKILQRRRARRNRPSLWHRTRTNFLTGLVIVAPVTLTIWVIWTAINFIDARVVPFVPDAYNPATYLGKNIAGFGVVIFLLFTAGVGALTKGLFGRQLVRWGESLFDRTPVVRSIYTAVKQIVETVLKQSGGSFQKACLIEYPRRGLWAVAFVSTETGGEIPAKAGRSEMVSVFLPTTPNPTSGFLLFVPRGDVVLLDMSVEEAAKLVISAGLVVPPTAEEIAAGRRPAPAPARPAAPRRVTAAK
ncbi:DUF502 domain-containing protein [Rhodobacteraceae bacterium 2CG4]|uniref:DUF502 domain-containing protein n=1 Tax=Halovulum marinum TaxID=2662447 RepID=A0A6L5Z1J1_9RHOB|nr:DUF502 domain-containing protein [Halovulum marinum]MSU89942.1 DUF502 domain-containing protein [Halovulum marinum]